MSEPALSPAEAGYAKVTALIEGQRARVAVLKVMGAPSAVEQAADLLVMFEDVLEVCRQAMEFERYKQQCGLHERIPANDP